MAVNRYKLRHKARMNKKSAILILKLLKRPDRLLGMVLIGNSLANILASAIATVIAISVWGERGVILTTLVLTIVILVFAEVAPKTLAALHADGIAKLFVWPVYFLLKIFYPLVWLINAMSNAVLRLFGVHVLGQKAEPIGHEELRSMVYETAGRISHQYQNMLLGILDLNKIAVEDVMIPAHQVIGLDLDQEWEKIQQQIATTEYDWLPVYRGQLNQMLGLLHVRDVTHALVSSKKIDNEFVRDILHEPYFVPEGTTLNLQLNHFQQQRKRMAIIVDEYGEVLGVITVEDILEEIVGEFTTNVSEGYVLEKQADNSYLVDGAMAVREYNRLAHHALPVEGPRTLNGLITEYLEAIPRSGVCIKIADYPIEIVKVKENRVTLAKIFTKLN